MLGKSLARVLMLRLLIAAVVLAIPLLAQGQTAPNLRRTPGDMQQFRVESGYSTDRDSTRPIVPVPPSLPRSTTGFRRIAASAGIIFSGTVASVSRAPSSTSQPSETLAITFHIEQGIRGASRGQDLTIFQWLGLWTAGQRYSVGDHVLLFLYPPSKLGLTSCVGGALGRFAVDPLGKVSLTAEHQAAFKSDWLLAGRSQVVVGDFQRAVLLAGVTQ